VPAAFLSHFELKLGNNAPKLQFGSYLCAKMAKNVFADSVLLSYLCSQFNQLVMPSFDIQSKVDVQVLDNAINTVNRELATRYDFKGTHYLIELDKKAMTLKIEVDSDMKLDQLIDVLVSRSMRQGMDANAYDLSKEHYPSGKIIRKDLKIKSGLAQEDSKKIVKLIKDSDLKVQPAIMGDVIRVTAKKIDDLQAVIALCRSKSEELKLPLQFDNMKN
jgi:uncharacterized protein YajQ (UPF0234 family)